MREQKHPLQKCRKQRLIQKRVLNNIKTINMKSILNLLFCTLLLNISGCSNAQPQKEERTIWSSYIMKAFFWEKNGALKTTLYYDSSKVIVYKELSVKYKSPEKVWIEAVDIYGTKKYISKEDSIQIMYDAFETPPSCFLRFYSQPIEDWTKIDYREAVQIADSIMGLCYYHTESAFRYADSVIKANNLIDGDKRNTGSLQVIINGQAYGYCSPEPSEDREVIPRFRNN